MRPDSLIDELLKRHGFQLHRSKKHQVYRTDDGKTFVQAKTPSDVRAGANSLVLRSTQAYLTASKGTGFLRSEPAQRWARQALFFLVWSCPAPIAQAAIRDLAGLCPG